MSRGWHLQPHSWTSRLRGSVGTVRKWIVASLSITALLWCLKSFTVSVIEHDNDFGGVAVGSRPHVGDRLAKENLVIARDHEHFEQYWFICQYDTERGEPWEESGYMWLIQSGYIYSTGISLLLLFITAYRRTR